MRFSYCLRLFLVACVLLTAALPAHADDTFLNDWFPSIFGERDKGPKPQDTLIAPFAQNTQKTRVLSTTEKQALTSPENNLPVTVPHRSAKYIAEWVSERVTGVFIYEPEQIKVTLQRAGTDLKQIPAAQMGEFLLQKRLDQLKEDFTDAGAKGVTDYLGQANILSAMKSKQQVQAFARNVPQIMNEGVFNDVYRWLIDVPVTVTVLPPGMENYMGKNAKVLPTSQNLVIRVQVARTPASGGYASGMVIETFTVLGASS